MPTVQTDVNDRKNEARKCLPKSLSPSGVTGESRKAFDYTCRHYLKISGAEFLKRFDAGEFSDDVSTPVRRVKSMLPFAR
jgi:hypothetical protein